MSGSLLVRSAIILTMNDRLEIVSGDVAIRDGRIEAVGRVDPGARFDRVIDAGGGYVLPGLIQTHIHLCQTLFRGFADDLPLLDWLRRRVWPMEAAHDADSLRAAARLAVLELLTTGTTAVLTMETVHETDVVFEAVAAAGLRATIGKAMMDAAPEAPRRLREDTRASIEESLSIAERWNGAANGRIRAALAPRFAVSCSEELLRSVAALSEERGLLVHTHASESRDEIALVRGRTGLGNVEYLSHVQLAGPRLCAAHCVWVDDREMSLLADREVKVLHCPSSNLKLGSGIAPISDMVRRGISVSLGTDGAACNNRLDMFEEMRLAALLQATRDRPGALPAREALWMATRGGARALGLEAELGSVESGKRADLIVVNGDRPHLVPGTDPISAIVYGARGSDVRTTIVDGTILVDGGEPVHLDRREILSSARAAARDLLARSERLAPAGADPL
jgi:cytosine/adenosine deaminase-related metal-dependent hydrolase